MIRPWFRHAAVPWKTTVTQTRASGENRVSTKPGVLQGEGAGLAAGQADVGGDGVAGAGHGDVGEQQPGDALAFPGWGGGVVPDAGQVGDQLPDPGLLFLGELPGLLLAGFVVGGL